MAKREAGQAYTVAKAIIKPLLAFGWNIEIEGLEHVPDDGGAIIAPNHISVLDSFFVPAVLPRRITYVGKAEYMDSWKTKHLFPAMGMIPIDRSGGDSAKAALDAAAGILERGELFGIYPEGTRSRDQQLHKGHTGVARLALRTAAPIIPVGIQGTVEVMPPDAKFPVPFLTVRVRFGRPINVTRYRDRADDRLVLRQITDELMYEIRELSGQVYVNEYATKKSEALPGETAKISTDGQDVDLTGSESEGPAGNGNPSEVEQTAATQLPESIQKLRTSSADVLRART